MSLILDALNRSRGDQSNVPGLATEHSIPVARQSHFFQWVVVAALVLAAGLIIYLLLDRRTESIPAPVADSAVLAEPVAVVSDPEVQSQSAVQVATPAPLPIPEPVSGQDPMADMPDASPDVSEKSPPKVDPAVAALYQQDSGSLAQPLPPQQVKNADPVQETQEPQQKEQTVDIEKMILQARAELDDTNLQEHSAPFISKLSQQTKDRIPTIYYQRHDYSGRAAQSSVVLNGKTVRPGGQVGSGVTVDEILPGSVVLSYQGTQFRLRALNSWVNL